MGIEHCDMKFLTPKSEGMNLIYALNLVYEIEAFQLPWQREVASQACTSIMAFSKLYNHAIAGRNMDFEPRTALKNTTFDVDFFRNNELVYKGTTFIGYAGLWTS